MYFVAWWSTNLASHLFLSTWLRMCLFTGVSRVLHILWQEHTGYLRSYPKQLTTESCLFGHYHRCISSFCFAYLVLKVRWQYHEYCQCWYEEGNNLGYLLCSCWFAWLICNYLSDRGRRSLPSTVAVSNCRAQPQMSQSWCRICHAAVRGSDSHIEANSRLGGWRVAGVHFHFNQSVFKAKRYWRSVSFLVLIADFETLSWQLDWLYLSVDMANSCWLESISTAVIFTILARITWIAFAFCLMA